MRDSSRGFFYCPNVVRVIILAFTILYSNVLAGSVTPGKDGLGGSLTGVINSYFQGVSAVAAGMRQIQIGSINPSGSQTAIRQGDLLLIVQMQGAIIELADADIYGDGIVGDPASGATQIESGQYEFVGVTNVNNQVITIHGAGVNRGLVNSYLTQDANVDLGQYRFQVVRVPQYSTATTTSLLTAAPWDGSSGGVLALDVAGQLTLSGTVSVTGLGFRGAGGRQVATTSGDFGEAIEYRINAGDGVDNDGGKGEGIAGTPRFINVASFLTDLSIEGYPEGSGGFGAPANAGGGGTNGTGGGGGANGGSGGRGGDNWSPTEVPLFKRHPRSESGFGGAAVVTDATRVFLGGGGGAGANRNLSGAHGGAGGGIVLIRAGSLTGTGAIRANGVKAPDLSASGNVGNVGGGGAGGTVIIVLPALSSLVGLTIEAQGGKGGSILGGDTVHAAGGGGGGGAVFLNGLGASVSVGGGTRGTSPAENQLNNGGTGQIPNSHLPARGTDGVVSTTVDVTSIPSLALVLPNIRVQVQALWSRVNLPGKARYKIRVENAVGAGTAQIQQVEGFNLTTGFALERVLPIVYGGSEFVASGPTELQNIGTSTQPILSAGAGITLFGGSWFELTFTVVLDGSVPVATFQRPMAVRFLDPQRFNANGTLLVSYDTASSTQDDIDTTLAANQAPIVRDDQASTLPSTSVVIDVLANDTDPDDSATIDVETVDFNPSVSGIQSILEIANVGQFSALASGQVLFVPVRSFAGVAAVSYTVSDVFQGVSNIAVIRVSVPNTAPIAVDDLASTQIETPVQLAVLLNDTDINGLETLKPDSLDLDPVTSGQQTRFEVIAKGIFEITSAGIVVFTPATGFSGIVSTQYTVTDSSGGISNAATITVNVSGVRNDPPVATDDDAITALDLETAIPVLLNDTDPNGQATLDPSSIDIDLSLPGVQALRIVSSGQFSTSATGLVLFKPNTGFTGRAEIQYTVADRLGLRSQPATIRVEVIRPIGTVVGRVFADLNGNGLLDLGELGLATISVKITDQNGNDQIVLTNARGEFSATVRSGNVTVDVLEVSGQLPSVPDPQVVVVPANTRGQARAIGLVTPRLSVRTQVDRPIVQVGSSTLVSAVVENTGEVVIQAVAVVLEPPSGFVFLQDSFLLNGLPVISTLLPDQKIRVLVPRLDPKQSVRISARVAATPVARVGVVTVTASGTAVTPSASLLVQTSGQSNGLSVEKLNQTTILLGRVYVDRDMNGQFDPTDVPLKGIRVRLLDGSYRITDDHGLYSFVGLYNGSVAVRLEGLNPSALLFPTQQDQLQPRTRLMRLNVGINNADFRVMPNSTQVLGELSQIPATLVGVSWREGRKDMVQIAVLDSGGRLVDSQNITLHVQIGESLETRLVALNKGQAQLEWQDLSASQIMVRLSSDAPFTPIILQRFDGQVFGIASLQIGLDRQGFSAGIGLQGIMTWQIDSDQKLTLAVNANLGWQANSFVLGGTVRQNSNPTDAALLLGDASNGSRDANSDDPFYLRYEWRQNYITYGRLSAGQQGGLSSYNALINGLRWQVFDQGLTIRGFATLQPVAKSSNLTTQQPFGFRGDGTSFYRLEYVPVLPESERVRVITRAKDNPKLIISEQELKRGLDYLITNSTGDIRLLKPLYPTDAHGNPVYLVVEYSSQSVITQPTP